MNDPSGLPTNDPNKAKTPVEKRRRKSAWWKIPGMVLGGVFLLLLLLALSALYIWRTEAGTRYAWVGAKILSGHRLQGVLEKGTLQSGIFLRDIRWRDGAFEVAIDWLQSQWTLTRTPHSSGASWGWVIPFIRIGQVDIKPGAPSKNKPSSITKVFPRKLTVPFFVQMHEGSVARFRIVQGEPVREWTNLHLAFETVGRGKAQHHQLRLDSLDTPYGAVQADVKLSGARPFALSGKIRLSGKRPYPETQHVSQQAHKVQQGAIYIAPKKSRQPLARLNAYASAEHFDVRLSGSLEEMVVDIQANGRALNGQGHIEASPFRDMPLKVAHVTINHLNPQFFNAQAPKADLHIEAQLGPARVPQRPTPTSSVDKLKHAFKQSLHASGKASHEAQLLTVEGEVLLRNAMPGSLLTNKLPLRMARSQVRLNTQEQVFSDIRLQVLQAPIAATPNALSGREKALPAQIKRKQGIQTHSRPPIDLRLEGEARFRQGKGLLNIAIQGLDLQRWYPLLAQTRLNGTLTWTHNASEHHQDAVVLLESALKAKAKPQQSTVPAKYACIDASQCDLHNRALPHLAAAHLTEEHTASVMRSKPSSPSGQAEAATQKTSSLQKNTLPGAEYLGLEMKVHIKPEQLSWEGEIHAGQGKADVSGSWKQDAAAHQPVYAIRSTFERFDPFAWLSVATRRGFAMPAHGLGAKLPKPSPSGQAAVQYVPLSQISGHMHLQNHWKPVSCTRLFLHSLKEQDKDKNTQAAASYLPSVPSAINAGPKAPSKTIPVRSSEALQAVLDDVKTISKKAEPWLDIDFALHDSVYQGMALETKGRIHTAGQRLLPSHAKLAVAGNILEAQGEWGNAASQLNFLLNAPDLSTIGWGLGGTIKAEGSLQGNLEHPQVALNYEARAVSVGPYQVQSAKGRALLEQGASGALSWKSDVQGLVLPQAAIKAFHIDVAGTQAQHTVAVHAQGLIQNQALDFAVAGRGGLRSAAAPFTREQNTRNQKAEQQEAVAKSVNRDTPTLRWEGKITQLTSHDLLEARLDAPVTLAFTLAKPARAQSEATAARTSSFMLAQLDLGHAQMHIEGAKLDVQTLQYSPAQSRSAGSLKGIDLRHLTRKLQTVFGLANPLSFIAIDTAVLPANLCRGLAQSASMEWCSVQETRAQKAKNRPLTASTEGTQGTSQMGSKSGEGIGESALISEIIRGEPSQITGVETDLVLDSAWDFAQQNMHLKGYAELHRRAGDLVVQTNLGARVPLDLQALTVRADAKSTEPKKEVKFQLHAQSGQFGEAKVRLSAPLPDVWGHTPSDSKKPTTRAAFLGVPPAPANSDTPFNPTPFEVWKRAAPISGEVIVTLPALDPIGNAIGANIRLVGAAQLRLQLGGTLASPLLSGRIDGEQLGMTFIQQGIIFKDGVVRIALSNNAIDFEDITFHGITGLVTLTGKANIDPANPGYPVLDTHITARELAIFATLDRQLSLSGQANMHYAGPGLSGADPSPLMIEGDFVVDRALFDVPSSARPQLGEDVIEIDRAIWKARQRARKKAKQEHTQASTDKATVLSPYQPDAAANNTLPSTASNASLFNAPPIAKIHLDLGRHARFHGAGADVRLRGALDIRSAPGQPLQANGDLRMQEGSTFEAFGRKLNIEKGYFAFHGPLNNPGIHVLAMRRNQEVEAGVLVTGTLRYPDIRLISEPTVPDSEKISWLLFGHGTSGGTNLGQQSTTMAALALLGNASGKRIAKTIGLDEFTIGQSESGLPDPQVLMAAKALNEYLILGYEQGLTTAASLVKLTWQLSRRWSLTAHTGTLNGIDIIHHQRFDSFGK